jgi:predicted PurR-regulated permease PerM
MLNQRKTKSTTTDPARGSGHEPLPLDGQGRTSARVVFVILLVVLALWIAGAFLSPLTWAAILAMALWPLYEPFAALFSRRLAATAAPLIFTLLVGCVLFLPVALAGYQMAQQGEQLLAWIGQSREGGIPVPGWVAQLPLAAGTLDQWWREHLMDPKGAAGWLERFDAEGTAGWAKSLGGELLSRSFMFLFSLLALFVLLRHGPWIAGRTLDTADRILGAPGERLASKMVEAVRGTVNGTVTVALGEGLLIGIGYAIAGVPSAMLFTVLTAAFAMLPFGAWAAFTAAALAVVASGGSGMAAAGVFGWGAIVMVVGDHFVWPTLVGGAARMPFLFALVGIFGGLHVFGLVGLFAGPVVMAALLTVWREWVMRPHAREQ